MFKPIVADIYHGDIVVDLSQAAEAGLKGVIHKATQGTGIVDRSYAGRRELALRQGLLWGAYHFANDEDVEAQVENFLREAKPDDNTLLALDFEPNRNNTMSLEQAREFLELMFQKTGRRPVLYSGNLIKEELGRTIDPFFGQHRLWISQYGPHAKLPPTWKDYWLWQYTGDGIGPLPHFVDGLRGDIDLNLYDGSPEQLAAEWAGGPPLVAAAPQQGQPQTSRPDTQGVPAEPSPPPIVVSTRSARRSAGTTRAPGDRPRQREAVQPQSRGVLLQVLRAVAVIGFIVCVVAVAVLGAMAPVTGLVDVPPPWGGIAGLAIGVLVGAVTFGSLLLLVEIAYTTRRSLAILERQSG